MQEQRLQKHSFAPRGTNSDKSLSGQSKPKNKGTAPLLLYKPDWRAHSSTWWEFEKGAFYQNCLLDTKIQTIWLVSPTNSLLVYVLISLVLVISWKSTGKGRCSYTQNWGIKTLLMESPFKNIEQISGSRCTCSDLKWMNCVLDFFFLFLSYSDKENTSLMIILSHTDTHGHGDVLCLSLYFILFYFFMYLCYLQD